MAIHAVVTCIDLAADEPAPERGIARVERLLPVLVPVEQVCELLEAFREVVEGETREDFRVRQIRLRDELARRQEIVLLRPMHGDLRLGNIGGLTLRVIAWRLAFWHGGTSLCLVTPLGYYAAAE